MTTQNIQTTPTAPQTERQDKRRKAVAIGLVGLGIAGLATASASMLNVTATDGVASGTTTTVDGLVGAAAILTTERAGTDAPTNGHVEVDLRIELANLPGNFNATQWTGTVYVWDTKDSKLAGKLTTNPK